MSPRKCPVCGDDFTPKERGFNAVYCSRKCKIKKSRRRTVRSSLCELPLRQNVGWEKQPTTSVTEGDSVKIHELKCWKNFFVAIKERRKTFELRINDRDFQTGDLMLLKEYIRFSAFFCKVGNYTGRQIVARITYVLGEGHEVCQASANALTAGYVIMGFKILDEIG